MRAVLLAVAALHVLPWGFNRLALWAHSRNAVRAAEHLLREVRA